jgi:Capsule polysaccharide biosynthesis protein
MLSAIPEKSPVKTQPPLLLFLYASQYADLFGAMARYFRQRHGFDSVLVVLERGALPNPAVYDLRPEDFDGIIDLSREITPRPHRDLPSSAVLAEAALKVEQQIGAPVNELIRSDRHAGIGFVLGGCYPRTRYGTSVDYDQAVDIVLRVAARTKELIAKRAPIAVVGGPGDIASTTMLAVTERAGIPLRTPGPSFSNVRFQWKVNKYQWPANLAENYNRLLAQTPVLAEDRELGSKVADTDRTQYARRSMAQSVQLRTLLRQIYKSARREVGHIVKGRNPIYGRPLLRDEFDMLLRLWFAKRRALRQKPVLGLLQDDVPFVIYALTVEPESTLQCESPMCDNQLAIIDLLAKTAPGGWKVVVKEHPAFTTPRPAGFFNRIRQYPNVILAAPYESGEALASRARAVAVTTGTLGFQAAMAGVPVLVFSPIWYGRFLPHVLYANSYDSTRNALFAVAENDLPPIEERRRSGRALLAALESGSIELKSLDILRERAVGRPVPEEDLRAICESLIASLNVPLENAMVPFPLAESVNKAALAARKTAFDRSACLP